VGIGSDMDNVLIVDDDPKALINFQEWFKVLYHFDVVIASDGEKAIDMLKKGDISVFCTGLNIPKVDGLELLAYVTRSHPETPCIVMSEYGVPWFREKQDRQDVLYYVEKPINPEALATAIFVGLVLNDEGVAFKGISVRSFLPLIWEKQKTCALQIESHKKGRGTVYFKDGQIVDATCGNLSGEAAIIEMAAWERIKLQFLDLPEELKESPSAIDMMGVLDIQWRGRRPRVAITHPPAPLILAKPKLSPLPQVSAEAKSVTTEDKLRKILVDATQTLKAIPGYQAVAILDTQWHVLTMDAVADVDFSSCSELMETMTVASADVVENNNLGKCQSLTVQTQKYTIIFLDTGKGFSVIVVLAPDSNWYFAKCRVEGGLLRDLKSFFWEQVKEGAGSSRMPRIQV